MNDNDSLWLLIIYCLWWWSY